MKVSKIAGLGVALGVIAAVALPAVPAFAKEGCHPAYETCLPIKDDLDCGEIDKPVTVKVPGKDPYGLDRDGDGIGCDSGNSGPKPKPKPKPDEDNEKPKPPVKDDKDEEPAEGSGGGDEDGSGDDDGSDLAVTGFSVWTAVGVGGVLLAAGGALVLVARRRKIRFTT